jgi:hypothetical protein
MKVPAEAGRFEEATLDGASAGGSRSGAGDAADLSTAREEEGSPRGASVFHDRDASRPRPPGATNRHGEREVKPPLG